MNIDRSVAYLEINTLGQSDARAVLTAIFAAPGTALATSIDGLDAGQAWFIADFTDGRITGRRDDEGWISSDQVFDPAPAPPRLKDDGDLWRLQQVRVFTECTEILIRGGDHLVGWRAVHLAEPPPDPTDPLRPRARAFLLGPTATRAQSTERHGFSQVTDPRHGTTVVLPVVWRQPNRDTTDGTWLGVCEHFSADPSTGAVGVSHTHYTGFWTGTRKDTTQ